MTSVPVFHWSDISKGASCVAGASLLKGPRGFPVHQHDFHEVFWIRSGRGIHIINGNEYPLLKGTMVWIRPSDCHGFQSDQHGLLVQNVAVAPAVWSRLRELFFPFDDHFWSGPKENPPGTQSLGNHEVRTLGCIFAEFANDPPDEFHSLRLLMNIFHAAGRAPSVEAASEYPGMETLPDWLADAIRQFLRSTDYLAGGTAALARLAGRSPEHVSRTLRRCIGLTPREWITRRRLRHAATQLRTTNRKILDISMECGFESLGHFYRIFAREYGVPPGDYRQAQVRPI